MPSSAAQIAPSADAIWLWGRALLALALTTGIAFVLALLGLAPDLAPIFPAILLAGMMLWALSRVPLGQLCGVLAFYAVASAQKEGVQLAEVAFAAYYLSYLAYWFALRLWVRRERLVRSTLDAIFLLLPVYVTASLGLTALFGGSLSGALSDWVNFSMFLFYFPIREACERYRYGPWLIVGIVLFLGTVAAVRNTLTLQSAFANAEYAWEVARGRAPMNEMLMLVPALGCLTFATRERKVWLRAVLAAGFAFFTVGVILTQWRSAYLDIAAGIGLLLLLGSWRERRRLVVLLFVGTAMGGLLAYALFQNVFTLMLLGILDRLLSIGTATQTDISLLNRFIEWKAAWGFIKANPIMGYGIGTEFGFYDAIFHATWVKSFIHNGFLLLWFKLGLVGLSAVLWIWIQGARIAFRGSQEEETLYSERTLTLACGVVLVALLPSTLVSTTFITSDSQMTFTLLIGIAVGLASRNRSLPGQ